MTDLINHIEELTGLNIYPYAHHVPNEECITYELDTVYDDGIKHQDRLTLRVTSSKIKTCYETLGKVRRSILTIGDEKNEYGLDINVNGGSTFKDPDTDKYHLINYFYLTNRS